MFRMAYRTLSQFIDLLAVLIRTSAKTIRKSIYVIVLIGLLGLNIASLTFSGLNLLLSGAIDTVSQFATTKSKSVRAQLDADVKAKGERIETLDKDVRAKSERIETLTANKTKKLKKFDSVTKKVIRRSRKVATRNIGSLAFESIPVVGVAVTAGLIVLEMNDICQTMKDVEDLRKEFGVDPVDENNQGKLCGFKVPQLSDVVGPTNAKVFCRWFKAKPDPLSDPDFDLENLQNMCETTTPKIDPPGGSTSVSNKIAPDDTPIPKIER